MHQTFSKKSNSTSSVLLLSMLLLSGCNIWGTPQVLDGPDESYDLTEEVSKDEHEDHDASYDLTEEVSKDEHEDLEDMGTPLTPIYRINAGGLMVENPTLNWAEDSVESPSGCLNPAVSSMSGGSDDIVSPLPMIPAEVLSVERWVLKEEEMFYTFPVGPGRHEVDLIFSENYGPARVIGARIFDVSVNNMVVLPAYDTFARIGAYKGEVLTFPVITTNGAGITILFDSGSRENSQPPRVQGIEVRSDQQAEGCPTSE